MVVELFSKTCIMRVLAPPKVHPLLGVKFVKLRDLPDINHSLYDSRDFIMSSRLAKRAFLADWAGIALGVPALLDTVDRLMQSCHLAEFTDHGLSHLCSLVDRISHWTLGDSSASSLVDKLSPNEAAIILIAVLIHDMGMLSQKAEDLPSEAGVFYQKAAWGDIAVWVRKTHVMRLPTLVRRTLREAIQDGLPIHKFMENKADEPGPAFFEQAIAVATAHEKWPWDWDEHFEGFAITPNCRLRGLAAILAVSDLLDEDSARCDTNTLLQHRHGTPLNIAHWLRHQLTAGRIRVEKGGIAIRMVKFCETGELMKPVYGALRNHFRLVLAYENELNAFGLEAGVLIRGLHPATGIPDESENKTEIAWQGINGFSTEPALCYQLLQTFMKEALKTSAFSNIAAVKCLKQLGLEDVDLSLVDRVEGDHEILTQHEKTFRAIIDCHPTLVENFDLGFSYLKAEARHAHVAGDGVLVLHILEIASTKLLAWLKDERASVTSQDIEWFFAMKLFWGMGTVDVGHELHEFESLHNEVSSIIDPTSKALIDLIFKHFTTYLGHVDIAQAINIVTGEWVSSDVASEFPTRSILLGLLIEHAWLRNNESNQWHELLDHTLSLQESESPVTQKPFRELKERLLHQKDLIALRTDSNQEPLESKNVHQIEDAYKYYLASDWNNLQKSLQLAKSQIDFQNPYYSAWHSLNRSTWSYILPDSDRTQISRWFEYASNSPFERYLTLLDVRLAERKEKEIDDNYSGNRPTIPAVAKQLIILQQIEIHILRKWDMVRYRFVLHNRAKCLMAMAHAEELREEKAARAFHAIHTFALSMNIPEKDKRFIKLFNYLAFGKQKYYESIVEAVLQSPKKEWVRLASIFVLLGDAIPETLVEEVVQWYIRLENTPIGERYGNATYLDEMVAAVRCSHDLEQWIDRLFELYVGSTIAIADKFARFVVEKGTCEQVMRLWQIQSDPTKIKHIYPENLWRQGFDIARHRADLRESLKEWLQNHCPDDANLKHDLAQIYMQESPDATVVTREKILNSIEYSFQNPSHPCPVSFQFFGTLPWPNERVLPLLDKIEENILQGKCNTNHVSALLASMSVFSKNADDLLLVKLSEICVKLLDCVEIPIKPHEIGSPFMSTLFFGNDPKGNVIRELLSFAESVFDEGGHVDDALVRYIKRNYASLTSSCNTSLLMRILLKLFLKGTDVALLILIEISLQYLLVDTSEHSEPEITNALRVFRSVFEQSQCLQSTTNSLAENDPKAQILVLLKEILPKAARSIYPSVRATSCELMLQWKQMNDSSKGCIGFQIKYPESLHVYLEQLKNDAHGRVRLSYENNVKKGTTGK